MRIRVARQVDRKAVLELLRANSLPPEGLDDCWASAFVARTGTALAGSAALEVHAPDAVLRSVAVAATHRGRGVGEALVNAALDWARAGALRDVYLLTETAAGFFPRFGFAEIPRRRAPAAIQQSIEYSSLCPASATSMVLHLDSAS